MPFTPAVLEVSDKLLLLAVDGNDGVATLFEYFARFLDVAELGVAVGV
jgi:hypothetical protein